MSTPAIIVLVWLSILTLTAAHMHGREIKFRVNFWAKLFLHAGTVALLYWGGFFN